MYTYMYSGASKPVMAKHLRLVLVIQREESCVAVPSKQWLTMILGKVNHV